MKKIIERKKKIWGILKPEIEAEINGDYNVDVQGLYEDDMYFHARVKLGASVYLEAQCDVGVLGYYAVELVFFIEDRKVGYVVNNNSFKDAIKAIKKTKILERVAQLEEEADKLIRL